MARPRKEDRRPIPALAIAAAADIALHAGPDAITLARVAEAAGCSAPALYRYFAGKDDLLRAAEDEGFRRLYAYKREAAASAGDDAFERLRRGGRNYVAFALENPGLYRLMFSGVPRSDPGGTADTPFARDPALSTLDFLADSLQRCQAQGYLPNRDPQQLAFLLWSSVHGIVSLLLAERSPHPGPLSSSESQSMADAAIEEIMSLIALSRENAAER